MLIFTPTKQLFLESQILSHWYHFGAQLVDNSIWKKKKKKKIWILSTEFLAILICIYESRLWVIFFLRKQGQLENQSHMVPKIVSRWRWLNSDIYTQNDHFSLVYDMIYQFFCIVAKNYKFGMFSQQCHPSVAPGDADIWQRNAARIHTCHLFTS